MAGIFRRSYAQFSEDLLLEGFLQKVNDVTYIDIGCLWPIRASSTYRFYQNGGTGVCIDPNPEVASEYRSERPRDQFVNCGIAKQEGTLRYSMFENPVFNTFDADRRDKVINRKKRKLIAELDIPVKPLGIVLDQCGGWAQGRDLDVLCVDVEGFELDVVQSVDLARLAPKIIQLELIMPAHAAVSSPLVSTVCALGYELVASTGHDVFFRQKK